MATLDDFRQLPQFKDFSDEQLVVTLSQKYGVDPGEVAGELGVKYNPKRGALAAGLSSGVDQVQGLGYGAIGAAARALGADSVAGWADRGVLRNNAEAQFNGRPDLERIEDQSLGSALPFLGYQVAKQVPMLAGTLATAAVVPEAAIPAAVSRGLSFLPKAVGGGGMQAGLNFAERRAALEAGNAFARTAAASYPISVGSLYGEAVERGNPSQGDALGALGLGVPYAAAEAVMPSMVRNTFGQTAPTFAGSLPTRLLKAYGTGAAGEGLTELGQNELEMLFAGNLSPEEANSRRLNSAAIGALVGGVFDAPAGFRARPQMARDITEGRPADLLNGMGAQQQQVPVGGQYDLQFPVTGEEAIGLNGLRNPFDAAGYVTGFQNGQETTVDVPQTDLFGGASEAPPTDFRPAVAPTIPVPSAYQNDPIRSAVAQASPATLRRDGSLKDVVEKALGAYSEFSDNELAAAIEELSASRKKDAVWRVAALEAIARQRTTQGATNGQSTVPAQESPQGGPQPQGVAAPREVGAAVGADQGVRPVGQAAQVAPQVTVPGTPNVAPLDAARGQGGSDLAGRGAGNLQVEPGVGNGLGGVTPAPLQRGGANPSVGAPARQQSARVAEAINGVSPVEQVAQEAEATQGAQSTAGGQNLTRPVHRNQVAPDDIQLPKLPKVQQQVFDYMTQAVRESRMGDIVDAEGTFQYAKIGAALGKKRGSIKAAVDGAVRRIAQSQGLSVEQFQEALRQRALDNRRVAGADYNNLGLSPDRQSSVVDSADVFGNDEGVSPSMEVVDSPAKTNSGGLAAETLGGTAEGDEILRKAGAMTQRGLTEVDDATDPVAERRAAEAQARREQLEAEMAALDLEADMTLAEVNWDSTVRDESNKIRAPKFAELPTKVQVEFALVSRLYEDGGIDEETMVDEVRAIAVEVRSNGNAQDAKPATRGGNAPTAQGVQETAAERAENPRRETDGQETGTREEVTPTNPLEARVAALRGLDLGEKQSARLDKLIHRYQNGEIDTERLGEELQMVEEQAFPEDKGGKGMRFSRTADTQGTTVEAVRSAINAIATPTGRRKVTVYQTADEAVQNGALNSKDAKGTQGWVDAKGNAFFIAGNIPQGSELAVALHEIGAHLGIEKLLADAQYEALVKKIFAWAKSGTNTLEGRIANAALDRVEAAKLENEADVAPEVIAYFVEEAVKAGVNPTAMQYKTELDRWFRTLWSAMKTALNKLGLINTDKLSAQDVVDLAYGAANLELSGKLDGETDGGTRFSKLNTSTPEGFFDALRNRTQDFLINPKGFMKEHGLGWLTLEQLADVVKSQSVTAYQRVMVNMQKFSKDRVHEAALIDVEWAKLTTNEQARLSDVMRSATRAEYDPEAEAPTNDEQRTINDKYEALTPAAKTIYTKVRDYYAKRFDERKQILLDAAAKAKADGKNTAAVESMFKQRKGPYFPLMRIGGWYSVGMSPELAELMDKKEEGTATEAELKRIDTMRLDRKHFVSRGHQSRKEAEMSRRELQQDLGVAYFNRAEERIGQEVAQLPDMAKLEAYLGPNLPAEVRGQVREMLAQAYFDALPEKSALKRMMKREGVHGEEEDMRRVFAASALSGAHHLSRLKYANDLSEAMVRVSHEGKRDETMRMVGNELRKRTALSMDNQQNPLIDKVMQVSYFSHLGLSPAFILTNMTQVPMITAPWLGARHGFAKSVRAIADAFSDTKDMLKATYAGKGVKDGWRSEFDWTQKFRKGSDEDKLFNELLDRNLLDITMEHDLSAVAEVRNTKMGEIIQIANLPVRLTETANRAITGLAAYRLARADGKSHDQAVEHAAKALSETQLNYSGLNTARHMQSVLGSKALARLMMQFRKFQQGMIYLVMKNAYDAVAAQGTSEAETKELRRIARRTLAGIFGTTALMAGTMGVPFMGTAFAALAFAGGLMDDDDEPFDPEVAYRNFLADMLGPQMAAVMAKGLPTLLNMDLSKRVGMADLGSPLPFARMGGNGTETVNNVIGAMAGAWAGSVGTTLDGVALLANGDYAKAAEKIVPIKAAQNLIRGYRYNEDGLTNTKGEVVVPAEKFSPWDIALRTAGFSPMRESEYYEANNAVEGAKRAVQETRTKLLRDYAQARLRGEETADIDEEIKAFNQRHPEGKVRIDYSAKQRAVQARRKMADERNDVGVREDATGKLYADRGRFAAP